MAPGVEIRKFTWDDIEDFTLLYNEVNGIAGTEKDFDPDSLGRLLSQPPCDPEAHCYLAESGGTLLGFALVNPELRVGRTVAGGGVRQEHRGRGIGRKLLRTVVEHARGLGASVLHVEVPSESRAARHLLESEDFCVVRRYWKMRWEEREPPQVELPQGYWLRPFHPGQDEEVLTRLQNTAFGDNWGFTPNTPEEVKARAQLSRGGPEGILLVVDGSRPMAYNWTMRTANERGAVGWVSMTGVDPEYRGKGLGRAVVAAGIQYLKSQGVDAVELEVDYENVAARDLYLKLGFRKVAETVWYEKLL